MRFSSALRTLCATLKDTEQARAIIKRTAAELSNALSHHAQRVKVPIVCVILEPSPRVAKSLLSDIKAANAALSAQARTLPGISLVSPEDIDLVSTETRFDSVGDELAHMPFTEEHYASIALAIARKVHALRVPAHKALVLDCDETLWRGVVGEDGINGITMPPALIRLQQFAIKVQAQGTLVCLVSKNAERDVLEVFEKRPEMALRLEHVVAHRINWESKPRNIAALARDLNLGLDSFVFIDDNPVECALMRAELPQVVTLQLPPDDEIDSFLSHLWVFDKVTVTDEDARRTRMYRENAARQELEESTTDIAAFIASLGVVIDIAPPEEGEWARVSQLTQRTNQFNFTTVRRTESEMRALPADGSTILRVKVRDRFGDYGLVGLVIARGIGRCTRRRHFVVELSGSWAWCRARHLASARRDRAAARTGLCRFAIRSDTQERASPRICRERRGTIPDRRAKPNCLSYSLEDCRFHSASTWPRS